MIKEEHAGCRLIWENLGNNKTERACLAVGNKILGYGFVKDTFREIPISFKNFRLPLVITFLILGLFFAPSATAGYW